jgi:hypothetical protein
VSTASVSRLESKLAAITALIDEKTDREFLKLVESLSKHGSAAALGALLAQVRDVEHDMMEVIMQAAERFPLRTYVMVLSRELVPMHSRAPYRTSIFVSRILQAPRYLKAFVASLEGAGPELQRALAQMFQSIREDRPDLEPVMKHVLRSVAERRRF